MMRIPLMIAALTCITSLYAQDTGWRTIEDNDVLHGITRQKFILDGKYLTPPRRTADNARPALVIVCRDGKVDNNKNYLAVDAVIDEEYYLEARIDGGKTKKINGHESTDFSALFFDTIAMADLLKGHQVILGAHEHLGTQIVMQFDIPDPAPILAACGKDLWFKKFKRNP